MKAHDANLKCQAGFYCTGGSTTKTPGNPKYHASVPTNTGYGDMCRKGHYCGEQSTKQFACEATKFLPYDMASLASECIACPNGKYCPTAGLWDLSGTTNDCEEGYYCQTSAVNARQYSCDYDEYCESGTLWPVKCRPEEYTPTSKASSCTTCNAGKRCVGGSVTDCAAGTYCAGNKVTSCPPGYYG